MESLNLNFIRYCQIVAYTPKGPNTLAVTGPNAKRWLNKAYREWNKRYKPDKRQKRKMKRLKSIGRN